MASFNFSMARRSIGSRGCARFANSSIFAATACFSSLKGLPSLRSSTTSGFAASWSSTILGPVTSAMQKSRALWMENDSPSSCRYLGRHGSARVPMPVPLAGACIGIKKVRVFMSPSLSAGGP